MDDESLSDIPICQMSNIGIDNEDDLIFYQEAVAESEKRRRGGYDINGKPSGNYDENNPPPGKVCGGFLKGNVGIIWKDAPTASWSSSSTDTDSDKPGYCSRCGYSLYHYADQDCRAANAPRHPVWEGVPPPSFAEANP
mmetsp:Transcript_18026/g.30166  ORF Transcript_18026/g.30166 Transcript_18026/m.30166 type:complete len:139 (-) Transcript_18026:3456-3872(-)